MAIVITVAGKRTPLALNQNETKAFKQLQAAVQGMVQVITGGPNGEVLVFDEERVFKPAPEVNEEASELLQSWLPDVKTVQLLGTVVLLTQHEAKRFGLG